MAENEIFLFVTPCSGVDNNLKSPVSVSIAYDIEQVGLSVGCPFAREFFGENRKRTTRCTAPTPQHHVTKDKAEHLPVCYHLNRKSDKI